MSDKFYARTTPPRGLLRLDGADRGSFLQGLISNDIRKLSDQNALWTALLTPQGKFLFDFFLIADGDAILIDAEGETIADLRKRLGLYKLRAKVVIGEPEPALEVLVAWGESAAAAFGLNETGAVRRIGPTLVIADPRRAALGLRIIAPTGMIGPALLESHGFVAADWNGWDRLRIAEGVPDGRRDMAPDKSILLENGFDELGGIAWDKGCYIGQELTARTKYRGLVKKRLLPVEFDGPAPPPGTPITSGGGEAGEIRSGQPGQALALIRLEALVSGEALVAGDVPLRARKPDWAGF